MTRGNAMGASSLRLTCDEVARVAAELRLSARVSEARTGVFGEGGAIARTVAPGLRLVGWRTSLSETLQGRLRISGGLALHVLTSGVTSAETQGVSYELRGLSAAITAMGEPREWHVRAAKGQVRGLTLFFDPAWFRTRGLIQSGLIEKHFRASRSVPITVTPAVETLAEELLVPQGGGALTGLRLECRALDLLSEVLRQFDGPSAGTASKDAIERVERAREKLIGRLANPPSVGELARELGVNARQLSREFAAITGSPMFEFVREQRLQMALLLLRAGDCGVAQVAYSVGYANPDNFATAFRRHFGTTPSSVKGRR